MRVIAGEFRRRVIRTVPGLETRPTPDRLRETLFNILAPQISGSVFLDAYAGSGAVGIEALSRGARVAIFIENSKDAIDVIEENLKTLGVAKSATILRGLVGKKLVPDIADLIFLDPPYALENEYNQILTTLGERDRRAQLVMAQHSSRAALNETYGLLARSRKVRHGENSITFYSPSKRGTGRELVPNASKKIDCS